MCFIATRKILGFHISVVNSSRRKVLKMGNFDPSGLRRPTFLCLSFSCLCLSLMSLSLIMSLWHFVSQHYTYSPPLVTVSSSTSILIVNKNKYLKRTKRNSWGEKEGEKKKWKKKVLFERSSIFENERFQVERVKKMRKWCSRQVVFQVLSLSFSHPSPIPNVSYTEA